MIVLNHQAIEHKIKRLSIQIAEYKLGIDKLYIAGINNNGYSFAKLLAKALADLSKFEVELIGIRLNPADPLSEDITLSIPLEHLNGKHIIIVDDVANTGRTLFYATKPLMDIVPASVEAAVLVDRTHKSFPISVEYVGLSLATTLKENIDVDLESDQMVVTLM